MAKAVVLHTKGGVNHILYVIVPAANGAEQEYETWPTAQIGGQQALDSQHPLEAAVKRRVHTLHVLQGNRQTQELLRSTV